MFRFFFKIPTVQHLYSDNIASVSSTTCSSSSHRNEMHNSPVARDSAAAAAGRGSLPYLQVILYGGEFRK